MTFYVIKDDVVIGEYDDYNEAKEYALEEGADIEVEE